MFNPDKIRDTSWGIEDTFNHLKFKKIGCTGDKNSYPLLVGEKSGYKGVIVGVPVDDYQAMVKHLDVIDAQLSRLEKGIDERMSVDEKLNIPNLSNKISEESQEEYMNRLSGQDECVGCEYEYFGHDHSTDINFSVRMTESSVIIETYLHTILYGNHREQRCVHRYHLGIQPSPLVEPSSISIVDMEESEINDYINTVRDWKKRGEEITAWNDYKDKAVRDAKDTIKKEIAVYVQRQEMIVPKLGSHDILNGYDTIKINPFAFWVSPDESVPDKYKGALKNESRQ